MMKVFYFSYSHFSFAVNSFVSVNTKCVISKTDFLTQWLVRLMIRFTKLCNHNIEMVPNTTKLINEYFTLIYACSIKPYVLVLSCEVSFY